MMKNIGTSQIFSNQNDGYLFKPERWLSPDGKTLLDDKAFSFLPFSAGPRVCIGEKIARTEMFLLIANIISRFEVLPDENNPIPGLNGVSSITLRPEHYNLVFKSRT